jgi:hypothetical protein
VNSGSPARVRSATRGDRAWDVALATAHGPQRSDHFGFCGVLQQIAVGSGADSAVDILFLFEAGQYDDARRILVAAPTRAARRCHPCRACAGRVTTRPDAFAAAEEVDGDAQYRMACSMRLGVQEASGVVRVPGTTIRMHSDKQGSRVIAPRTRITSIA